jgi:hypothetical protein
VLLASLTHLSSMTSVDSAELEGSSIFAEVWPRLEGCRLAKDRRRALNFSPGDSVMSESFFRWTILNLNEITDQTLLIIEHHG